MRALQAVGFGATAAAFYFPPYVGQEVRVVDETGRPVGARVSIEGEDRREPVPSMPGRIRSFLTGLPLLSLDPLSSLSFIVYASGAALPAAASGASLTAHAADAPDNEKPTSPDFRSRNVLEKNHL